MAANEYFDQSHILPAGGEEAAAVIGVHHAGIVAHAHSHLDVFTVAIGFGSNGCAKNMGSSRSNVQLFGNFGSILKQMQEYYEM